MSSGADVTCQSLETAAIWRIKYLHLRM